MWINYTDKEVEHFHPVCKEALQAALDLCRQSDFYEIQHHRYVGDLEMDFVIANKITNKIICVIEVKRTIAAVHSIKYQLQAMNYVQSLSNAELELPYYMLTNLECSCLFRYDKHKHVYEQMIEPGISLCHTFNEIGKIDFINALAKQYASFIKTILSDSGTYFMPFGEFAAEIKEKQNCNPEEWKYSVATMFYEYIRGSLYAIHRTTLLPANRLRNINNICREVLTINFKDIFNIDDDRNIETKSQLLKKLYDLGHKYIDADELANVMHKVVSDGHEHEGEVATDVELANMIMWLLHNSGMTLSENERILDPAAGSGNLLSATCEIFPNIRPSQLVANDINPYLLQLLSLRLGLKFANTVSISNSPTIYSQNIANLEYDAFKNVKCIVMNPPFLAATDLSCTPRKKELFKRISSITGNKPKTQIGQMPLEGVFIELITTLACDGCTIACILPHTHLTGRGVASKAIRQFLLDEFGLQTVFNYPSEGLFSNVNQNTAVIIGIKGHSSNKIRFIYSQNILTEIDVKRIANIFKQSYESDADFEIQYKDYTTLKSADGWQFFNIARNQAKQFVNLHLKSNHILTELRFSEFSQYQRGKVQNLGGTDLLFPKSKPIVWNKLKTTISPYLKSGMRNADYELLIVGNGDQMFLDVADMDEKMIYEIASAYTQIEETTKKQARHKKTANDYMDILKIESRHSVPPNTVLLPRGIRSKARVFVTDKTTFPSTNFFTFTTTHQKAIMLSYWMSSVFYQLENEIEGKNNKGLRKLEQINFNRLLVPNFNNMTEEQISMICNTPFNGFLDLRNPKPRPIDYAWATVLFGSNATLRLNEAVRALAILVADREA